MRVIWFTGAVLCAFHVKIEKDASFTIDGENGFGLKSGSYMLRAGNKSFTTNDGSLAVDYINTSNGSDVHGVYSEYQYIFTLATTNLQMNAYIRHYDAEFIVFRQHFQPNLGWKNMSTGDLRKVITSFPSVKVPQNSEARYINPCDDMGGWLKMKKGSWNVKNMTNMCGGEAAGAHPTSTTEAGPFFIFDKSDSTVGHHGQTFTISSFSKFTVHFTQINHNESELWFGLPGTTDSLPDSGFDIETIISYSDRGFYDGVQKWGGELRTQYGKSTNRRDTDDTINYLSYWTNQGAFYYYNTEPGKNYAQTVKDIYAEIHGNQQVPFRSWNFDSWWYPKCQNKGVKKWEPIAEVFPAGMSSIFQSTSLPVIAHNKWWCNETDYAKRNGGSYDFRFDDNRGTAVPTDLNFWPDLFKNATTWGLDVYLQDWLDVETDHMSIFENDLELERNWLLQMGEGAKEHGINVLYCMAYCRHMLQSVEIENVVSMRASDDYQAGNDQWHIGLTSAWIYALGLAPFKDNFWTTSKQPGNPLYGNSTETHPKLESAMATLATGIVGISDKIGHTGTEIYTNLVSMSIMSDGKILKPSRPLVVPDFLIWDVEPHPVNGTSEYETWSEVAGQKFGIILCYTTDLGKQRTLRIENYHFQKDRNTEVIAAVQKYDDNDADSRSVEPWSPQKPLKYNMARLNLIYASPTWKLGPADVSLIGEDKKWVPVSTQRFYNFDLDKYQIRLDMRGVTDEFICIVFSYNLTGHLQKVISAKHVFGKSARTSLIIRYQEENPSVPLFYFEAQ